MNEDVIQVAGELRETNPVHKDGQEVLREPVSVLLRKERKGAGSTELFTYEVTVDGEVIITGLTESAAQNEKNRRIVIPEGIDGLFVAGIGDSAFAGLPLVAVILPKELLEIGSGAFYGCNLETILIPKMVSYIGPGAFGANHSMQEIDVAEMNRTFRTYNRALCTRDLSMVLQMPASFRGWKYKVPASVKVIGEYAFGNCRNLKRVYVEEPSAVIIRENAFWNTNAIMMQEEPREKPVVGDKTEVLYYDFDNFDEENAFWLSYIVNANNSISIHFDRIFGELKLNFPELLDMRNCTSMTIRLKSEFGDVAIKLYDEQGEEAVVLYQKRTNGIEDITVNINCKHRITRFGIMANDSELLDYSNFDVIIYTLRFEIIKKEPKMVAFDFNQLHYKTSAFLNYLIREDGSLDMSYAQGYGEIRFAFPEQLDMSKCTGIVIRLKSEKGKMNFSLYDETFRWVDAVYGCMTDGVQDRLFVPTPAYKSTVAGIGFSGESLHEGEISSFDATVYSITFYMTE